MRGPQYSLRQIATMIAVIGVLLAFWVQMPMSSDFLASVSMLAAVATRDSVAVVSCWLDPDRGWPSHAIGRTRWSIDCRRPLGDLNSNTPRPRWAASAMC